MDQIGWF